MAASNYAILRTYHIILLWNQSKMPMGPIMPGPRSELPLAPPPPPKHDRDGSCFYGYFYNRLVKAINKRGTASRTASPPPGPDITVYTVLRTRMVLGPFSPREYFYTW